MIYQKVIGKDPETAQIPCMNCGKMVTVTLPFYGCIYCAECMEGQDSISYTAATEQFTRPPKGEER